MVFITDSGMSVSFQSGSAGSAGTFSQESSPQQLGTHPGHLHNMGGHMGHLGGPQQGHVGGPHGNMRSRKVNSSSGGGQHGQSTQL